MALKITYVIFQMSKTLRGAGGSLYLAHLSALAKENTLSEHGL